MQPNYVQVVKPDPTAGVRVYFAEPEDGGHHPQNKGSWIPSQNPIKYHVAGSTESKSKHASYTVEGYAAVSKGDRSGSPSPRSSSSSTSSSSSLAHHGRHHTNSEWDTTPDASVVGSVIGGHGHRIKHAGSVRRSKDVLSSPEGGNEDADKRLGKGFVGGFSGDIYAARMEPIPEGASYKGSIDKSVMSGARSLAGHGSPPDSEAMIPGVGASPYIGRATPAQSLKHITGTPASRRAGSIRSVAPPGSQGATPRNPQSSLGVPGSRLNTPHVAGGGLSPGDALNNRVSFAGNAIILNPYPESTLASSNSEGQIGDSLLMSQYGSGTPKPGSKANSIRSLKPGSIAQTPGSGARLVIVSPALETHPLPDISNNPDMAEDPMNEFKLPKTPSVSSMRAPAGSSSPASRRSGRTIGSQSRSIRSNHLYAPPLPEASPAAHSHGGFSKPPSINVQTPSATSRHLTPAGSIAGSVRNLSRNATPRTIPGGEELHHVEETVAETGEYDLASNQGSRRGSLEEHENPVTPPPVPQPVSPNAPSTISRFSGRLRNMWGGSSAPTPPPPVEVAPVEPEPPLLEVPKTTGKGGKKAPVKKKGTKNGRAVEPDPETLPVVDARATWVVVDQPGSPPPADLLAAGEAMEQAPNPALSPVRSIRSQRPSIGTRNYSTPSRIASPALNPGEFSYDPPTAPNAASRATTPALYDTFRPITPHESMSGGPPDILNSPAASTQRLVTAPSSPVNSVPRAFSPLLDDGTSRGSRPASPSGGQLYSYSPGGRALSPKPPSVLSHRTMTGAPGRSPMGGENFTVDLSTPRAGSIQMPQVGSRGTTPRAGSFTIQNPLDEAIIPSSPKVADMINELGAGGGPEAAWRMSASLNDGENPGALESEVVNMSATTSNAGDMEDEWGSPANKKGKKGKKSAAGGVSMPTPTPAPVLVPEPVVAPVKKGGAKKKKK